MDLQHFSHQHLLKLVFFRKASRSSEEAQCSVLIQDQEQFHPNQVASNVEQSDATSEEERGRCFFCEEQLEAPSTGCQFDILCCSDCQHCLLCFLCKEPVEGPNYCCIDCKFYLHKTCVEIEVAPKIYHPLHPPHPLILITNPSFRYLCNFCHEASSESVYRCDSCSFDLDISCALLQQSIAERLPRLEHRYHEHPLIFIENHNKKLNGYCSLCEEKTSGEFYRCLDCINFDIDKECAELPLEINHPFHTPHPLVLLQKSPYSDGRYHCNFCHKYYFEFAYHCASCNFDLDVRCAKLQRCIDGNFDKLKHPLHEHTLILNNRYNRDVNGYCSGCCEALYGPIYRCLDCRSFDLHKACAGLSQEINHYSHRQHPLTLLLNSNTHPNECSCYLCYKDITGFFYYCSACQFSRNLEDVSLPPTIYISTHAHPWKLLSRTIGYRCDACGTDGQYIAYLCIECNLIVHKKCLSLPGTIKITRHPHPISHAYFLQQNKYESWECRICGDHVDSEFGSYHCSTSNCSYIAHVNCATDKEIWDGTSFVEVKDEESKGTMSESTSLITNVIKEMTLGEDVIATEIKHKYHKHNLIFYFGGEVEINGNSCNGCMLPVSDSFYSCGECKFFLHRKCAELPREKQDPRHRHELILTENNRLGYCYACKSYHHGFSYKCKKRDFCFQIDIQCSSLPDNLSHPSHEHRLILDHKYIGNCTACSRRINKSFAYRCKQRCEFAVDFKCIILPFKAWYKCDKHLLALTYQDDPNSTQFYCDICEEERSPSQWFYSCADCDTTVHPDCVLGDLPFIELGRTSEFYHSHPHNLTFVKYIWNCPPCAACRKHCNGQALECKEPDCNYTIHWRCRGS